MLKFSIVAVLLISSFTFKLEDTTAINVALRANHQGFNNFTGSRVTEDQINNFIYFVRSASAIYTDVQKHLVYIVNQMNLYLGNATEKYSVILQTEADESSYTLYCIYENYAFREGINQNRLSWSYMFYRYSTSANGTENFISNLSKGADLPDSHANAINSIIT